MDLHVFFGVCARPLRSPDSISRKGARAQRANPGAHKRTSFCRLLVCVYIERAQCQSTTLQFPFVPACRFTKVTQPSKSKHGRLSIRVILPTFRFFIWVRTRARTLTRPRTSSKEQPKLTVSLWTS